MSDVKSRTRPTALAIWMIIAGAVGWWAAFQLTVERFQLLSDPDSALGCDYSILVQCRANLESAQGAIFGFPNPLMGIAGWIAPIVIGVAILSGARFARWFWLLVNLGMLGAFALVCWLIGQSIFVLGTLCPWCMVTWIVTIPTFYAVTLHNLRIGALPAPARVRRAAKGLMSWVPLMAIISYAVVVLLAQLRLDALTNIFS